MLIREGFNVEPVGPRPSRPPRFSLQAAEDGTEDLVAFLFLSLSLSLSLSPLDSWRAMRLRAYRFRRFPQEHRTQRLARRPVRTLSCPSPSPNRPPEIVSLANDPLS